jgi:hypothetical protein
MKLLASAIIVGIVGSISILVSIQKGNVKAL